MALYRGCTKVSGIGQSFNPENTGTEGQVLTKTNSGYAYCDIPQEIPSGGTEGQVLTKTADGYAWCDSQGGGLKLAQIKYLAVGGGGGGAMYNGGGGGQVLLGRSFGPYECIDISIGAGGLGGTTSYSNGGSTCLSGDFDLIAYGGGAGTFPYGASNKAGNSGSGCTGGCMFYCNAFVCMGGGGGGGATGNGANGTQGKGANGGAGLCGYGGGGGGGGSVSAGTGGSGGGNGGKTTGGCNASACGGGGGGGVYYNGYCLGGGCGGGGLVHICYRTNGRDGITSATGGDSCYVCDGYCVHEFTSDGTFCITG